MTRPVTGVLATERGARAALTRVAEPGDPRVAALVAEHGPQQTLALLLEGTAPEHDVYRRRTHGVDLAEMVAYAARRRMRVVVPGDDDWPIGLDELGSPPACLWVVGPGELGELRERGIAIVGARACTAYGIGVAAELSAGLAEHGYVVVSGAAYGIDRAAHEGALLVGGDTIAVLAGGVDRAYPPDNASLIGRIAQVGAVISEVSPGGAPTRSRFLQRNRLIATMTTGTLVVEAGIRSGSLNTARSAGDHARPVGAVPGPVTSRVSAGCHEIVRNGMAGLITDLTDALDLFGRLGDDAAAPRMEPARPEDGLPPQDRLVLGALPLRAPATVEAISAHAGLAMRQTRASLGRLELVGLAARFGVRWKQAIKPKAPTTDGGPASPAPNGGRAAVVASHAADSEVVCDG